MQILINIVSYLGIILWVFGAYLAGFSHLRSMVGRAVVIIWHKKYLLFLAFFAGLSAYGGENKFSFPKTRYRFFITGLS